MEAIAIDHQDYVDIPEPPKGKGGRPVDPRLLQIAIRCHKKTDAHKVTVFRCIGTAKGCTTAWKCKTRIKKRILGHFSITVNSIADERTASTITWLNSALRNRQKSVTLINQVQIRQWYTMSPENVRRKFPLCSVYSYC